MASARGEFDTSEDHSPSGGTMRSRDDKILTCPQEGGAVGSKAAFPSMKPLALAPWWPARQPSWAPSRLLPHEGLLQGLRVPRARE